MNCRVKLEIMWARITIQERINFLRLELEKASKNFLRTLDDHQENLKEYKHLDILIHYLNKYSVEVN